MAFSPIAFTAPNYRDYKNEWLKAYEPGTPTPKPMATDSTGNTLISKAQLNKDGFIVSAGQALIIPYLNGAYDLWLFPTEPEADANDTSNALRIADNIVDVFPDDAIETLLINDLSQAYEFENDELMRDSIVELPLNKTVKIGFRVSSDGDGGTFDTVLTSSVTPDGVDFIQSTVYPLISYKLRGRYGAENLSGYEVYDLNFDKPYRMESDYELTSNDAFGIIQTGQSLDEGGVGNDVVSEVHEVAFSGRTLMFSPKPMGLSTEILSNAPIDLVEPARVTTGHSMTKNLATGNENVYLFSGQAWGGQPYSKLKKGGSTGVYEKCIDHIQNADNAFNSIRYLAITTSHGEQDALDNNLNYSNNLNEWQTDFNADIKAITGQVEDTPLFLSQTSGAGAYGFNGGITETDFPSPLEQLEAHETYSNVVMICSKYNLETFDHAHLKNISQRILGEYFAKAIPQGNSYEPLRPSTITPSGSGVIIDFVGNVGSLAFDTTLITAIVNQGFSYIDDSANTITSVTITGAAQVTVGLSGAVGANAIIAYAYHNGSGGSVNQQNGLGDRGNLRDSDTAVSSYNGISLYNWCVIFKKAVN